MPSKHYPDGSIVPGTTWDVPTGGNIEGPFERPPLYASHISVPRAMAIDVATWCKDNGLGRWPEPEDMSPEELQAHAFIELVEKATAETKAIPITQS